MYIIYYFISLHSILCTSTSNSNKLIELINKIKKQDIRAINTTSGGYIRSKINKYIDQIINIINNKYKGENIENNIILEQNFQSLYKIFEYMLTYILQQIDIRKQSRSKSSNNDIGYLNDINIFKLYNNILNISDKYGQDKKLHLPTSNILINIMDQIK